MKDLELQVMQDRWGTKHLGFIHTDRDRGRGRYRNQIKSIVPIVNVHTGPTQSKEPGPIVSYCVSLVPRSGVGPVAVHFE